MSLSLLSATDLRQIVETGQRIQEAEDPEGVAQHVQEVLHRRIGADVVVWNELTADGKVSTGMTFPDLPTRFWTDVAPGMLAHIHEHPFVQRLTTTREPAFTAAISDLMPTAHFVQTGLYAAGYREFAAKHQISSARRSRDGGHLVVSLNRRRSDFGARDKALLEALTQLAAHAYQRLRDLESLQFRIQQATAGRSPSETSWLYVDDRLIVKWGAHDLERYLQHHFHHQRSDIFLPEPLALAVGPLVAGAVTPESATQSLTVRRELTCIGKHYRLNVVRERRDHFRITISQVQPHRGPRVQSASPRVLSRREAEAAHWASLGKTNPEIAIILGISPRTVEKHVHAALAKLDFENRVQLARWVAESDSIGRGRNR